MYTYFVMFILGLLFVVGSVVVFIKYQSKKKTRWFMLKLATSFSMGIVMLVITLPSLQYVIMKDYTLVSGTCTIDHDSTGRSTYAKIHLQDINELFSFKEIPPLDAYGKNVPYHCEVLVTKDRQWEVSYKIFDLQTGKLLYTY